MKFRYLFLVPLLIIQGFLFSSSVQAATSTNSIGPKFKLPDYVFQIPIGTLTKLNPVDCSSGTCNIPFLSQYIAAVYKYGLSIAGILGVLIMMAAGLLWMVSGGDTGKINKAKQLIMGSVTGLILVAGLVMFLSFINPDLVLNKVISIPSIERIEPTPDSDVDVVGGAGENPYQAGCVAAKKGDLSVCRSLANTVPAGLVGIAGGEKLTSSSYEKFKAAMECVKKKNNGKAPFYINDGWRPPLEQIAVKEAWTKKGQPGNAATPCCSNHGIGSAMDIGRIGGKMTWNFNDTSGLKECMNAQGLYARVNKYRGGVLLDDESWHWSPSGR